MGLICLILHVPCFGFTTFIILLIQSFIFYIDIYIPASISSPVGLTTVLDSDVVATIPGTSLYQSLWVFYQSLWFFYQSLWYFYQSLWFFYQSLWCLYQSLWSLYQMVTKKGTHGRNNLCYLICLRPLIRPRVVTNRNCNKLCVSI